MGEGGGLDGATVYDVIRAGAGTSKMFEVRGPMMVGKRYLPATMTVDMFLKDLDIIRDFAASVGTQVPLLQAILPLHEGLRQAGRGNEDTASVRAAFEGAR